MHIIDLNTPGDFLIEKQLVKAGCALGFSDNGIDIKLVDISGVGSKGVIPINSLYGDENTDGVVGVSSQKGGFSRNHLVGKYPHTGQGQFDSIAYELNIYLRK